MAGGEQVELKEKEVSTVATKQWQWTDGGFEKTDSHVSQRVIVQRLGGTNYASIKITSQNNNWWKKKAGCPGGPDIVDVVIPIRDIRFGDLPGNAVQNAVRRLDERIAQLLDLRDGLASDPAGPLADLLAGGWEKIRAAKS